MSSSGYVRIYWTIGIGLGYIDIYTGICVVRYATSFLCITSVV